MQIIGGPPTTSETLYVLRYVADVLGVTKCWFYVDGYHFRLGDTWSIALTPESAGRFRVETCRLTIPRDTRWCRCCDLERMRTLVLEAEGRLTAPTL